MKRNRNRAAFMTAWISAGDMKLLIKTLLGVGQKRYLVFSVVVQDPEDLWLL